MRHPSSLPTPQGIGAILQKTLQKAGVQHHPPPTQTTEALVFRAWNDVAGEQVAAVARPALFNDGQLTIEVTEKVWLQELHYFRGRYLQQINAALPRHAVHQITFTLAAQDDTSPIPVRVVQEEADTQPHDSPRWLHEVLPEDIRHTIEAKIADMPEGDIKNSARRILIRHHQIQQMRHRQKRPRLS